MKYEIRATSDERRIMRYKIQNTTHACLVEARFSAKTEAPIHKTALYICREGSTNRPLYAQNKPNFMRFLGRKWRLRRKTNPIQTQFKPNQTQFFGFKPWPTNIHQPLNFALSQFKYRKFRP